MDGEQSRAPPRRSVEELYQYPTETEEQFQRRRVQWVKRFEAARRASAIHSARSRTRAREEGESSHAQATRNVRPRIASRGEGEASSRNALVEDADPHADDVASDDDLRRLLERGEPFALDAGRAAMIEEDVLEALWGDGMSEGACAVCDELWPLAELGQVDLDPPVGQRGSVPERSQRLLARMVERLSPPPESELPPDLKEQHRVEHPLLRDVLLSPRGAVGNPATHLQVCTPCRNSLWRPISTPPKFSIANGFAVGRAPAPLSEATDVEIRLLGRVSPLMAVEVLRGGRHRVLKSHVAIFDARPSALVRQLPSGEPFNVILTGSLTDEQRLAARRSHRIRGDVLHSCFNWLHRHNPLYSDASWDEVRAAELDETSAHIHEDAAPGAGGADTAHEGLAARMDSEGANIRQRGDADAAEGPGEEILVREMGAVHVARDGRFGPDAVGEAARARVTRRTKPKPFFLNPSSKP